MSNQRSWLFLIISCILLLIALSSCSGSSADDGVRGNTVELRYSGSNAGPKIVSIEIDPRGEIEEQSEFYIAVVLENGGSQDLSQGIMRLVGFNTDYLELSDNEEDDIFLAGYNRETNVISDDIFVFNGYTGYLLEEESEEEVTVFVDLQFDYDTVLEQEVCINPANDYDIYGNCENQEGEVRANPQYSPVAVTSFEQHVSPYTGKVTFEFHIENNGQGEVERISLIEARLTLDELDCEFVEAEGGFYDGEYVFGEGEEQVDLRCEYRFDPNSVAMEKVLYLDLHYTYSLHDSESFTLVKQ